MLVILILLLLLFWSQVGGSYKAPQPPCFDGPILTVTHLIRVVPRVVQQRMRVVLALTRPRGDHWVPTVVPPILLRGAECCLIVCPFKWPAFLQVVRGRNSNQYKEIKQSKRVVSNNFASWQGPLISFGKYLLEHPQKIRNVIITKYDVSYP